MYVNDPVNTYDLNGQWSVFGFIQNVVRTVIRAVVRVVVATVKAVVRTVARVAATVSHVARKVVSYGQKVVAYVAPRVVSAGKAVTKAVSKTYTAVRDAGHAAAAFTAKFAKHADWISMTASVASIGVCVAAVAICGGATIVAAGIGAVAAVSQSYAEHGSLKRAGAQAIASLAFGGVTGAIFTSMGAALKVGRIGVETAKLHGAPYAFLGGKGVEGLVDGACDASGGIC